jgi:hypothetical protein
MAGGAELVFDGMILGKRSPVAVIRINRRSAENMAEAKAPTPSECKRIVLIQNGPYVEEGDIALVQQGAGGLRAWRAADMAARRPDSHAGRQVLIVPLRTDRHTPQAAGAGRSRAPRLRSFAPFPESKDGMQKTA